MDANNQPPEKWTKSDYQIDATRTTFKSQYGWISDIPNSLLEQLQSEARPCNQCVKGKERPANVCWVCINREIKKEIS